MKHAISYALLGILAGVATADRAVAQTQSNTVIQLYAGLTLTGPTGTVQVIQYTTDPAQSNSWSSLAFVQLPATHYLWVDASAPVAGHRFYRAVPFDLPTKMVFLPPGNFTLGSPTNEFGRSTNEGPRTAVTISRGFWIGQYEVFQAEYVSIMATNPSYFTGDLSRPVEQVTWLDATNYCAKLTQQDLASGRIPAGSHYRLPTEAEWEYAARAGTSTRFNYGDDPNLSDLAGHAWFSGNSGIVTHPVGEKPPNAWGLYDMEGNVREWTGDWFAPFPGGTAIDPQGPAAPFDFLSTFKVTRGGGFDDTDLDCRSAARGIFGVGAFVEDYDLGFRVVLVAGE